MSSKLSDTHPLVLYSRGQISSAVGVRSLKIRDHAELLVYQSDSGLSIPMPSDEEIAAEIETSK